MAEGGRIFVHRNPINRRYAILKIKRRLAAPSGRKRKYILPADLDKFCRMVTIAVGY
jgi:hypothetical protein